MAKCRCPDIWDSTRAMGSPTNALVPIIPNIGTRCSVRVNNRHSAFQKTTCPSDSLNVNMFGGRHRQYYKIFLGHNTSSSSAYQDRCRLMRFERNHYHGKVMWRWPLLRSCPPGLQQQPRELPLTYCFHKWHRKVNYFLFPGGRRRFL